jgi:putative CocE/NonD family hydrolase
MPWGTRLSDVELADASPAAAIEAFLGFAARVLGRPAATPPGPTRYYSIGAGWKEAPTWPPAHRAQRWTATSHGGANSRHGDGRLVDGPVRPGPADVLVAEPLVPYPGTSQPLADVAAAEDRRDVLCYTSAPLASDMEVAGSPVVEAVALSDSDSFDIVATLVLVTGERCRQLTSGSRRVGPQPPGAPLTVTVALGPVGITAPAGSRWRLDLSASRFPVLDRNPQCRRTPVAETPRWGHRVAIIEVRTACVDLPVVRSR